MNTTSVGHRLIAQNKLSKRILLQAALAVCLSFLASSQEAAAEPPTMLITPSGYEQSIDRVGNSISVITREDLEETKAYSLGDAIRSLPGVQPVRTGPLGRTTSVFLRGASSAQTLILVDGVPVNGVNSGQFDLGDLTAQGIEKVEVLKGSQSLMYGSDAMGGVINIITQGGVPASSQVRGGIEVGNYDTQQYTAGADLVLSEEHAIRLDTTWFEQRGVSAATVGDFASETDPYDAFTLSSSYSGTLAFDIGAEARFRYLNSNADLDGFDFMNGPVDAFDFVQDRKSIQSLVSLDKSIDFWHTKVDFGYTRDSFVGEDPIIGFNNYNFTTDTLFIRNQHVVSPVEWATSVIGYSYERNMGKNVDAFNERRGVHSFYGEQQLFLFEGNSISGGVRHDEDSTFGDEITFRLSMAQLVDSINSKLHTSYSTGFRAPSFNDLYFPGFSNPDLKAEESKSFDVGVSSEFGPVSTDITFFRTSYSNLIQFDTMTFLPHNIGSALSYGVEGEVTWQVCPGARTGVSYTYLDARDRDTDAYLARRARHQGGGFLSLSLPHDINVRTDLRYIAGREDSTGVSIDDYLITDVIAEHELNDHFSLYIKGLNLFDVDYEEVPGYGTLGAQALFGIRAQI